MGGPMDRRPDLPVGLRAAGAGRTSWLRPTATSTTSGRTAARSTTCSPTPTMGRRSSCSHEMSIFLAGVGIEAIGMNKGGTFEAAGIGLTMVHAEHSGGATITGGETQLTRDLGCWGWVLTFEDGTVVYHSGDTDLFGDMALVRERWAPSIAVLPIGGHYTMGPRDAARAAALVGASTVIPVHFGTFPTLTGTPEQLAAHTSAEVVRLEPGETWSA